GRLRKRSVEDPLTDHVDRRLWQRRAVRRHSHPDRRGAFELLDQIARVGIARRDAEQRRDLRARNADEQAVAVLRVEPQAVRRRRADMTRRADRREYELLNRCERRLEHRLARIVVTAAPAAAGPASRRRLISAAGTSAAARTP